MRTVGRALRRRLPEIAVFGVAAAVRAGVLAAQGGMGAGIGYDQSVYYAAADALVHGRMPYRDFHLLHPPLLMLVLTPFAWMGSLTRDTAGYAGATVFGLLAGALCAALVVRIARRLGYTLPAALTGGLFYALAPGAVVAEYSMRLEPMGNLALLLALLALVPAAEGSVGTRRRHVLGGIALGAAVSVKIWYAVPVLVILGWLLLRAPRRRTALDAALGVLGAGVLFDLPFFVLAPSRMFHMIVTAQLGRPVRPVSPTGRISSVLGVGQLDLSAVRAEHVVSAAIVLALVVAAGFAGRSRGGALFAALALAQVVVLVASPSWFPYYDDYTSPAVALLLAAAVAGAAPRRRAATAGRRALTAARWTVTAVPVAAAIAVTLTTFVAGRFRGSVDYPIARLHAALAGYRCLITDDPEAQIYFERLSADLAAGCPDWVDVSGTAYWPNPYPYGTKQRGEYWIREQVAYFRSGDAALLVRDAPKPAEAVLRALAVNGVIAAGPLYHAYRGDAAAPTAPNLGAAASRRRPRAPGDTHL